MVGVYMFGGLGGGGGGRERGGGGGGGRGGIKVRTFDGPG